MSSQSGWARVQQGLLHPKPWVRGLTIVTICLAAAAPAGAIIGLLGALYGTAALVALAASYLMLRSVTAGLVILVGVICLLPFAALPINIGFAPTFLDLVLLLLFFVWASQLVTYKQLDFIALPPTLPLLAFALLAMVSFISGLTHSRLTANLLRHFLEILLSVLVFLLVVNTVRTKTQLKTVVMALVLAGFAAAGIGVVLYVLPEELTVRLLSVLRIVRYPSGSSVLRYIEDNPELPLRATSTSVDPNVLGGMLIFVTTITGAQVVAKTPLLPRVWLLVMFLVMAVCMVLTFSRGAFAGLAVALLLMGLFRYPRMLWIGLAVLSVLAALAVSPPARIYVQHFLEGVQGQDLAVLSPARIYVQRLLEGAGGQDVATQMRMGEYRDALLLIARYPWFGVGFSGTPDIDTYLGVSSVYLLIAQEMGILGLLAFLAALVRFFVSFVAARLSWSRDLELEPIVLGTCLAVAGAAVGGTLDHYLFNLDFPHAAALLWLVVGLGASAIRLGGERSST
ncbi:MAG TPA: O-antigen ligase family protein [Anaerolineae bacterium]|nr:O-antigen ligase family protein [Anaerolineae bacterium]